MINMDESISLDIYIIEEIEKIQFQKMKIDKACIVCNTMISKYKKKLKEAEDIYNSEEMEKTQSQKFRFDKFNSVCNAMISIYENKLKETENIFKDLEQKIARGILDELKAAVENDILDNSLFEEKDNYLCYKLPLYKIYIKKQEIKVKDQFKEEFDEDFIKNNLIVKDEEIVNKETGELMNQFFLTDNEITIKYI